jgi:hypothetical protein
VRAARDAGVLDAELPVCIAPRLLLIDNGYSIPTPRAEPTPPGQLAAPNAFRGDDSAASRAAQQEALETFERLFPDSACGEAPNTPTVAHIDLIGHPGVRAPLGWTLSRQTRAEMVGQVNNDEVRCGLVTVRNWFGAPTGGRDVCVEATNAAPISGVDGQRGIPPGTQIVFWTQIDEPDGGAPRVVTIDARGEFHLALSAATEGAVAYYCLSQLATTETQRLTTRTNPAARFSTAYPSFALTETRRAIDLVDADGRPAITPCERD